MCALFFSFQNPSSLARLFGLHLPKLESYFTDLFSSASGRAKSSKGNGRCQLHNMKHASSIRIIGGGGNSGFSHNVWMEVWKNMEELCLEQVLTIKYERLKETVDKYVS